MNRVDGYKILGFTAGIWESSGDFLNQELLFLRIFNIKVYYESRDGQGLILVIGITSCMYVTKIENNSNTRIRSGIFESNHARFQRFQNHVNENSELRIPHSLIMQCITRNGVHLVYVVLGYFK